MRESELKETERLSLPRTFRLTIAVVKLSEVLSSEPPNGALVSRTVKMALSLELSSEVKLSPPTQWNITPELSLSATVTVTLSLVNPDPDNVI